MMLIAVLLTALQASPLDSADRYAASERERQRVPGLSVAVLRGDTVLLARGYGFANVEHRVPASDSTIYQSGSVGKQFTAAAVVMLSQDGRLGLDDPIVRHLPEGGRTWQGVTVRHLLAHTSGIPDYTDSTLDYARPIPRTSWSVWRRASRSHFDPASAGATATPDTSCSARSFAG